MLQKLILASADEKNRANIASKLERALTHQIHTVIDTPGYLVSRADLYCFILYDSCIRGYTGLGAQFQSDFVSHGTIDQSLQTYILGDELTTFLFGSILEELASMPQSALFRRKYDFFVNQAKLCQPLFEEMMEKTFTIRKTCRYQPQLTQDQQNVLQRAQQ